MNYHERRMRRALVNLHSGDLSPRCAEELERHLASCAACRATLNAWKHTESDLLRVRPEPATMDPDRAQALFERALRQTNTGAPPLRVRAILVTAAVAALLTISLFPVLLSRPYPGTHPTDALIKRPVHPLQGPRGAVALDTRIQPSPQHGSGQVALRSPKRPHEQGRPALIASSVPTSSTVTSSKGLRRHAGETGSQIAAASGRRSQQKRRLPDSIEIALAASPDMRKGRSSARQRPPASGPLMAHNDSRRLSGKFVAGRPGSLAEQPPGSNGAYRDSPSVVAGVPAVNANRSVPAQQPSALPMGDLAQADRLNGSSNKPQIQRRLGGMSKLFDKPVVAVPKLNTTPPAVAATPHSEAEETQMSTSLSMKAARGRPSTDVALREQFAAATPMAKALASGRSAPSVPVDGMLRLDRETARFARLNPLVDVQFTNATVKQAAEAMTLASSVKVQADKTVPADIRLTVKAQGLPLASVLETVGNQANLMIAPANDGVQLKPWPDLTLNGRTFYFQGALAPWSVEWGLTANSTGFGLAANGQSGLGSRAFGRGGGGGFGGGAFVSSPAGAAGTRGTSAQPSHPPNAQRPTPNAQRLTPVAFHATGPATVTRLSDTSFVMAEPVASTRGDVGTMLTTYTLEKGQLHRVTSAYHPAAVPNTPKP